MKKYGIILLKTRIKNKLVKLISIGERKELMFDFFYDDYSERMAV